MVQVSLPFPPSSCPGKWLMAGSKQGFSSWTRGCGHKASASQCLSLPFTSAGPLQWNSQRQEHKITHDVPQTVSREYLTLPKHRFSLQRGQYLHSNQHPIPLFQPECSLLCSATFFCPSRNSAWGGLGEHGDVSSAPRECLDPRDHPRSYKPSHPRIKGFSTGLFHS